MKKLVIASFIMLSSCSWLESIGKWGDENMPVYNEKPKQHVEGNRQAPAMQNAPAAYPYGMPPASNMPPLNPADYPAPAMSGDQLQQQYQAQQPIPYYAPQAPSVPAPAQPGQYSFGGAPAVAPAPSPYPPQIPQPPQGYGQPPQYQPQPQPQGGYTMQSTGQKYDDFPPEYRHVKH